MIVVDGHRLHVRHAMTIPRSSTSDGGDDVIAFSRQAKDIGPPTVGRIFRRTLRCVVDLDKRSAS